MNKYIKLIMKPDNHGGGSFSTFASFELDNIDAQFNNVGVKIDTGCSVSTIPLAKFSLLDTIIKELKHNDIVNKVDYMFSYGVESGGKKHSIPKNDNDKIACEAIKFKHSITNFEICGFKLDDRHIYVNYDRIPF